MRSTALKTFVLVFLSLLISSTGLADIRSPLEVLTVLQYDLEKNISTLSQNERALEELLALNKKRENILKNMYVLSNSQRQELMTTRQSIKLIPKSLSYNRAAIAGDKRKHRYHTFIIKKVRDGQGVSYKDQDSNLVSLEYTENVLTNNKRMLQENWDELARLKAAIRAEQRILEGLQASSDRRSF